MWHAVVEHGSTLQGRGLMPQQRHSESDRDSQATALLNQSLHDMSLPP